MQGAALAWPVVVKVSERLAEPVWRAFSVTKQDPKTSINRARAGCIEGLARRPDVSLRITQANLRTAVQPLEEAASLLNEVRLAWAAIAPDAARP